MLGIKRISHATFQTTDLERQIEYNVAILGLSLAGREKNRAFFKTTTGIPSLVMETGGETSCRRIAFQVAPGSDLGDVQKKLKAAGIAADRRTDSVPGIGALITFKDPKGTDIDVFAEETYADADLAPKHFVPLKLGHLAFKVTDIRQIVAFYQDVLGFRVSDWRQDFFVFMRCGPDHHTVNFATAEKVKMHHIAYQLRDVAEMTRACDFLGRNNYRIIWGPGRHVIGDNIFTYHKDPDGHIIELYCELAQIDSEDLGRFNPRPWRFDIPYKPTVWGPDTLGNLWGPGAPPGFGN